MAITLKSAQTCHLWTLYCMLVRIVFKFSYDSFMVVLQAVGTDGRVLLLCSKTAFMLFLDASKKSRQLVLSYGISSCSKSSTMSLQKHKSSFTVNKTCRFCARFLYNVIFTLSPRRLCS